MAPKFSRKTTAAVSFSMFLGSYEVMFLAINDNEQCDEGVACHSAHIDGPDFHVAAHSSTGPLSTQNKVGLTTTLQKEGRRIRQRETAHACDTVFTYSSLLKDSEGLQWLPSFLEKRGAISRNKVPI